MKNYALRVMKMGKEETLVMEIDGLELEFRSLVVRVEEGVGDYRQLDTLYSNLSSFSQRVHSHNCFRTISAYCFHQVSDENLKEQGEETFIKIIEKEGFEEYKREFTCKKSCNNREKFKLSLDLADAKKEDLAYTNCEYKQNDKPVILCKELIKNKARLPDMKKLSLTNIHIDPDLTNSFLEHCFPDKLELLTIDRNEISSCPMEAFMPPLVKALKNVTREIFIRGFELSTQDFVDVVQSSGQCRKLKLFDCVIETRREFRLEMSRECRLEVLDLERCGKYSDWGTEEEQLDNVLKAICESNLMRSLREIAVADVGVSKEEIQKRMNGFLMEFVKAPIITENADWDAED
ncbi:unnamed protein product [Moneuplotes crassus]|uniref:Uncharacterized protein n=1 Tax=Euplotes crassus TaxID=5936 RepID=A0AAD1U1W3_EUPCR|nr:unnamed protein product [Moneuplotes crassus]